MKRYIAFLFLFTFSISVVKSQVVLKYGKDYILGDRIVVEFNNTSLAKSALSNNAITQAFKSFGITSIEPTFKFHRSLSKTADDRLSRIMTLKYTSPVNPVYLAKKISQLQGIKWAEPYFLGQLMYTPNDPQYSSQWPLRLIKASQAWDVTKGDTSVVLAINDTGVDWDHPDLAANIWTNPGEIPNNGIDDDGNGYVDDVHGWDFGGTTGTPDNNPMEDRPDHGTHVAGIASAVTDNNIGIASIGFKCKIMPVKTAQDNIRDSNGNPLIVYGYQGIIYAADNGAKVMNASWGSYSYSNVGQEVVDYAISKGMLIVGAAGNETQGESIYPGAYKGALSVGAVDSSDVIAYFSNYGKRVDVFAPGVLINSTWQNDTYISISGTSMASPFVTGLAGLVFSHFPNYSPEQVAQQIRVTADNIYDKNASKYDKLLGHGRINAYAAVSTTDAKSVRIVAKEFEDLSDKDGIFKPGEDIGIKIKFKNILNATNSLTIQLTSPSQYVTIKNGTFDVGTVAEGAEFDNYSQEFVITLSESIPENYTVPLLIKYTDGNYGDFEWLEVMANPTYLTQNINNIALTFTSKGTMAFNDYPTNLQGDGFKYKGGPNLLFEGALIYGTGPKKVDNAARNDTGEKQDADFTSVTPFHLNVPGSIADEEGESVFNDFRAFSTHLQIVTTMKTYSFSDEGKNNFIIVKYNFANNSTATISGFRAGLFFDWDMDGDTYDDNVVAFDDAGGFGYAYSSSKKNTDAYVTCALISNGDYSFYAIRNDGTDGGINIYDGFSDDEKWTTLSNGTVKNTAGPQDISFVAGGGEYSIPAGGSVEVAFAIAAAESLDSLRSAVATAKNIYESSLTGVEKGNGNTQPSVFSLSQNYPNPFNPTTTIKYSIPAVGDAPVSCGVASPTATTNVRLTIYDVLGRVVATLVNQKQKPGNYSVVFDASKLASGVYFYKLRAGNTIAVKKMILLR